MLTARSRSPRVSIALIGQPGISLALLFVLVFIAGWCVVGGSQGQRARGTYYPTDLRSTGVGWGLGVGRIGAIVGPVCRRMLMGRHWGPQQLSCRRGPRADFDARTARAAHRDEVAVNDGGGAETCARRALGAIADPGRCELPDRLSVRAP